MAEKKDSIRTLIDTGRRIGKLTSSEISDAMEENGNVLDVEAMETTRRRFASLRRCLAFSPSGPPAWILRASSVSSSGVSSGTRPISFR